MHDEVVLQVSWNQWQIRETFTIYISGAHSSDSGPKWLECLPLVQFPYPSKCNHTITHQHSPRELGLCRV